MKDKKEEYASSHLHIRAKPNDLKVWAAAAKTAGFDKTSPWITKTLNDAAREAK